MTYRRPPSLATWPLWRRELWGQRANDFEAAGVPWPESEKRAFEEISIAQPPWSDIDRRTTPRRDRVGDSNIGPAESSDPIPGCDFFGGKRQSTTSKLRN